MSIIQNILVIEKNEKCFFIEISFGLPLDQLRHRAPSLCNWERVSVVDDFCAYEQELLESNKSINSPDRIHGFKKAWKPALDIVYVDGEHTRYSEYITNTPVTLAIVEELWKVHCDKNYCPRSSSSPDDQLSYVIPLLECLAMHWD